MAVAFDTSATSNITTGTTQTIALTVASNSDRVLVVATNVYGSSSGANLIPTGITYNGDAMTKVIEEQSNFNGRWGGSFWKLIAPDVGTANVVVTYARDLSDSPACSSRVTCMSFYDSSDTTNGSGSFGFIDSANGWNKAVTSEEDGITIQSMNIDLGSGALQIPGSYTTMSQDANRTWCAYVASDPGSSTSMGGSTAAPGVEARMLGISVLPLPAGLANLKTIDGLAKASTLTVNGEPLVEVLTWNGVV